jgi:hypothetical protein
VNDEAEKIRAYEQGWRDTPQEALDHLEARDDAKSTAAAERHAADARMSEKAQREAAAADQETLKHLPEIPEESERKRKQRDALAKAREAKAAKKAASVV